MKWKGTSGEKSVQGDRKFRELPKKTTQKKLHNRDATHFACKQYRHVVASLAEDMGDRPGKLQRLYQDKTKQTQG
ncbi:hypothetical protein J5X98_22105 [Leptothermofonsia sichuanensis E412]|uniref:hypothetical protein n=1 Tax=Leptothermofonsia sichuanensis TaxID=2917832 RepID=UPI001CA7AA4C|nr:hypothetical protein [Leptothermofonsia sichuanensis]QZZ19961.1 hypothetical protein J5X98_22105 [Leptothermofonsia sichuanensis E412]